MRLGFAHTRSGHARQPTERLLDPQENLLVPRSAAVLGGVGTLTGEAGFVRYYALEGKRSHNRLAARGVILYIDKIQTLMVHLIAGCFRLFF